MSMPANMPIRASNLDLKPRVVRIPWALVAGELCEQRCQSNHGGQTLQRIYERQGFDAAEALAVICNQPWRDGQFGDEQSCHRLLYMMAALYRRGVIEGGKIAATASSPDEAAKLIRDHINL